MTWVSLSTGDLGIDASQLHLSDTMYNELGPSHSHHVFQHQSSIVSTASVQTVLHLNHQASNGDDATSTATNGCGNSVHESISTASFHSVQTTVGGGGSSVFGLPQSSPSATSAPHSIDQSQHIYAAQSHPNYNHPQTHPPINHHNSQYQPLSAVFPTQRPANNTGVFGPSTGHIDETGNGGVVGGSVLRIGDVADLLHPQYAIITGGRARDGSALITFPDHCNFHLLADGDYANLIMYLTSVPS